MAAKFLNLDAFAPAQRTVALGGKEYVVEEVTVARFILMVKHAQELEKKGEITPEENFRSAIEQVKVAIPTMPTELLERLTLDQLKVLIDFIRGEFDEQAAKGMAEAQVEAAQSADEGGEKNA